MTDTRDLRDPQKLGESYLASRKAGLPKDIAVNLPVRNYPHGESMSTFTAREYRTELEARAEEGDRYALSALESLNQGKGVVGYDDAGA